MFSINMTGQNKLKSILDPTKYAAAARSAFGQAHTGSLLQASNLVSTGFNLAPQFLLSGGNGSKPIIQAGPIASDGLSSSITVKSGGISLIYFGAEAERATSQKRKIGNVKVQIKRGKTTKLRQFMVRTSTGQTSVFRRAGKGRLPIIQSAVSASALVNSPSIIRPLSDYFRTSINSAFSAQLKKQGVIQ